MCFFVVIILRLVLFCLSFKNKLWFSLVCKNENARTRPELFAAQFRYIPDLLVIFLWKQLFSEMFDVGSPRSSCGDAPVASLPAAGEPAPPGPDPEPDGQEGPSAAAQHGAGRPFPAPRPLGVPADVC